MPTQTTYAATMPIGIPGMIADMRNTTTISRELAAASNPIPFGAPVMRGMTDHTCMAVGTAGAGGFLGISALSNTIRPIAVAGTANAYAVAGDTAAVMIRGIIWVTVTSAVTPGAAAYFDGSGNITATATANTAISGAVFETTAASGGLAQLRIGS